jgi:hypothetical protein
LRSVSLIVCLALLIFGASACKTPAVPSEIAQVKLQENELWRAGAPVYAPDDYSRYIEVLRLANDKLIKEKAKFGWFRDYQEVRADFVVLLASGEGLIKKVQEEKASQSRDFSQQLALLKGRIGKIKAITLSMNENARVRESLAQAEVVSQEANLLLGKEKYPGLSDKIHLIDNYIRQAEDALFSILARYADDSQVQKWRKWAADTIAESKKKGTTAVLVNKLERTLTVYKKGIAVAVFDIGLGKYGLSDKLHAGDEATPEGRYKVIKKNANSNFYKALLIDYPNEEDKKQFAAARKRGEVPPGASIGGLIEIHGGGNDSLTNGCVGLENTAMDKIFSDVSVGTPVTIVGSLEDADQLLAALRKS